MNRTLTDNVAVVTGASSGIGRATAYTMAEAGATVVLAARRTDRIEEVAATIVGDGGRALAVTADVTNADDVDRLYELAVGKFGRLTSCLTTSELERMDPSTPSALRTTTG